MNHTYCKTISHTTKARFYPTFGKKVDSVTTVEIFIE